MAQVTGLKMVGGAYHRGHWCSGWSVISLDDGTTFTLSDGTTHSEDKSKYPGMVGPLDEADRRGHDTKRYRERLDEWVKTAKMPPHEVTPA